MKKTLLTQIGSILLLFSSSLSFANTLNSVSNKTVFAVKNVIKNASIVRGTVTDRTDGQALPGVSIKIKGTQLGTVTDVNGNFSINAESDAVLVFSFVGYDLVEVAVGGKSTMAVKMGSSTKNLNEVVVVGYGTQKKTSVTAAVSTINAADIALKPVTNLGNLLGGRASGLVVTQGSGEPGFDQANILIRGTGTLGSTQPLLIVDGVPRDFSRLDPAAIATMSVLKDAAAVAPYGVAGANGVILVTTKQGKTGKPVISYNGYAGTQNPTRVPDFVNSYQYATLRNIAQANDFGPVAYTDAELQKFQDHSDPDAYGDSKPLKEVILPNQLLTYHNVTLSGGSDVVKYFAALGYTRQNGMWKSSYNDKYNATGNFSVNATKNTTINFSLNTLLDNRHFPTKKYKR